MLIVFSMLGIFLFGAEIFSQHSASWGSYECARKAYITFCCAVLALQSGLRGLSVGDDTMQYYRRFASIKETPWQSLFASMKNYYLEGNTGGYKDPGYDLLEKIFQIPGFDYRAWLLFVALVFFVALGVFLYNNTDCIADACFAFVLYMIIYYSFYSVTGIRQTIAMALCLFAFECAKKRRIFIFILLVLLASSIHKSALLFLPAILLINFKNARGLLGLTLLLLPVIYLCRSGIVSTFGELLGYEDYTTPYASAGAYGYSACALIAAILVWIKAPKIISEANHMRSYIALFSISIAVIPALWIDPSIMRVAQYYSIFILVLFPVVLRSFEVYANCSGSKPKTSSAASPLSGKVRCEPVGHVYLLCMLFLIAYFFLRFYDYQYNFFFMDLMP